MGSQEASFTRTVGKKDPESIVASSAELLTNSEKVSDILYYASKMADFVLKEASSKHDLDYEDRMRRARQEWSRIKRKEGLEDDPVVTKAIVSAVAKAIGKGKK